MISAHNAQSPIGGLQQAREDNPVRGLGPISLRRRGGGQGAPPIPIVLVDLASMRSSNPAPIRAVSLSWINSCNAPASRVTNGVKVESDQAGRYRCR